MTLPLRACCLLYTLLTSCELAYASKDPILSGTVRDVAGTTVEFATVALHRAAAS